VIAVKLDLTSLDLSVIVKELNSALISARIDNIYQLEDGSFLIKLHSKSGQASIIIDLGRRLNITNYKYPIPEKPSSPAATLRRYLCSTKIESIGQVDLDRIIYMDIFSGQERLRIYFELFGDGNAIVTDNSGKIKFALHYREMKDRTIKYGRDYVPPPRRGHDIGSSIEVDEIRMQKFNLVRVFTRTFNLPSEVVEEALVRSSLNPSSPSDEVNQKAIETFLRSARSIVEEVNAGPLKPNIVMKEGKTISVQPIEFQSLNYERKYFESFNEAVDEYFTSISTQKMEAKRRSPSEEAIMDLEAILSGQRSHLKELELQQKIHNEIGKSVMSNLQILQSLINDIIRLRKAGTDWQSILRSQHGMRISGIDPVKGIVTIIIEDKEIPIDFKISAAQNAGFHFTKSKEACKKLEGLHNAIIETKKKKEKLEKGIEALSSPVILRVLKKEWYERFRWTFSSENFLIIGGKDATQNEVLVKKHMEDRDIFMHSDVPGGSVVITKSEGKKVSKQTMYEAVSFAVTFSKAWKAGLGASDGYWVMADQVTKTPPSGEYLGKGAFMIYGERNYIRNIPLEIWFGIQLSDNAFKVVIGNEAFVKKAAVSCVKLVPGIIIGEELIKKIKESLAQRADKKFARLIHAVPNSEIVSLLPTGGSSVI
jgi:predicted ribosome quality control (RQC) complex YloA/Tae2 family protein